MSEIEKMYRM